MGEDGSFYISGAYSEEDEENADIVDDGDDEVWEDIDQAIAGGLHTHTPMHPAAFGLPVLHTLPPGGGNQLPSGAAPIAPFAFAQNLTPQPNAMTMPGGHHHIHYHPNMLDTEDLYHTLLEHEFHVGGHPHAHGTEPSADDFSDLPPLEGLEDPDVDMESAVTASHKGEDTNSSWNRFAVLETAPPDHAFLTTKATQPSKQFSARLQKEYRYLRTSLPG